MPDAREYGLVVADAEQAARGGDYPRADVLLREALRLQESTLGSQHPDLASTLNNLAVVCETLGRLDDAEQFYRRAFAVASWSRPPADPLVVTSRENLKDFCAAHGRSFEEWPGIGLAEAASAAAQAPGSAAPVSAPSPPASPESPPAKPPAPIATPALPVERAARTHAVPAAPSSARRASVPPPASNRPAWTRPVVAVLAFVAIIGAVVLMRSWRAAPPSERAAAVQPEASPSPAPPATNSFATSCGTTGDRGDGP